jgi:hypothetical protein
MATTENETDWSVKIGAGAYASIVEMVAALECDYERLEELRDARDGFEFDEDANLAPDGPGYKNDAEAWAGENPDDAEELKELEEAAGDCASWEDAETRIQEDPLSLEFRSDWEVAGTELNPYEFNLLLSTGGPAVRIIGELDANGEPCRARLEVQDWFKPWTEYVPADMDTLLTYCRVIVYVEM